MPDGRQHRAVERQPVDLVQLIDTEPTQFVVIHTSGRQSTNDVGPPEDEFDPFVGNDSKLGTRPYGNAEFLAALPHECLVLRFVRLDLATRKLPAADIGAARGEHAFVNDDRRGDNPDHAATLRRHVRGDLSADVTTEPDAARQSAAKCCYRSGFAAYAFCATPAEVGVPADWRRGISVRVDESDAPGELADDGPPDKPTRRSLRRIAGAVGDTYRAMDPDVAQLITAPGVLPRGADAEPAG